MTVFVVVKTSHWKWAGDTHKTTIVAWAGIDRAACDTFVAENDNPDDIYTEFNVETWVDGVQTGGW